jgi:hypothetical protein
VWWSTFRPPQTPLTRRFVVYYCSAVYTAQFDEFHASDLLSRNKPFEGVERETAKGVIETAVSALIAMEIPIVYGAVDLGRLYATN